MKALRVTGARSMHRSAGNGRQSCRLCVSATYDGLFREDVLVTLGRAIEQELAVTQEHPPIARS
jgi:hypothetical protein